MLSSFDSEIASCAANACWTSFDAVKSAATDGYYNAAYLSATTPDPLISLERGLDDVFFAEPYVLATAILLDFEPVGVEHQPTVVDSEIVRTIFYGADDSDIVSPATAEVVNSLLEQSRLENGGVARGSQYVVAESPAAPNSVDQLIAQAIEAGIDYDILSNFTIQPSSVQKLPVHSSSALLRSTCLFENVSDAGEEDEEMEQPELAASHTITHAKSPSVLISRSPQRYNKRPRDATPSATLTVPPPPPSSSSPPSVEVLYAPSPAVKKTRILETTGGADVACNLDYGNSLAPSISRDALFAALKHLRPSDMTVILPTTASTSEAENSSLRNNMSLHATSFSSTSPSSLLLRPLRLSLSRNNINDDSSPNDSSAAETTTNGKTMNFSSSDDAADGESGTSTNPRGRPRHSESKSARYARQHRLVAKQRRENMFEKRDKLRVALADMEKEIDTWNEEKASLIAKLRESYAQASEAMKSKLDSTLFL